MNTDFLIGFMETARTNSIAKASEALHLSHTALSKQLRSLEQQFDVQLFTRSSQGVELTEAGRVLYDASAVLLDQLAVLSKALEPHKVWKQIRIGTVPDIASRYLLPSLHKLEAQGHQAELVYRQSTAEAYRMLMNGEVELLVAERISMHPALWMGDLHREPLFAVVPKAHPFAAQTTVALDELSGEPLVLYAEGCTIRAKLTDLFLAANLPMHIKTEVSFKEVILGYVDHGAGLTVLPESHMSSLPAERLVGIPLGHPDAVRTIAVFGTNRQKGKKMVQLLR
ncbi:LysR family transcriptional regulator [Paenibacillus methanolicus]|uniref:LysR family hydrogen peroxide-inducible transcriptional activator n=1 Tax=Paenibacillus methanolicus TaxID=582686 RepID=A0A5S5C1R0_9BACL|nr:LysR family transcriptional regulator [Paenibacillus methanolicus]TYP73237.1 LysR family hydrogen peroxide-inducible transcriptional activator [Paenibacillus methanolicus]